MRRLVILVALSLAFSSACSTTSTEEITWTDPQTAYWVRPGQVESVHEIVRRTEGNPAGGALLGGLIGGLLFGRHGRVSPFGAVSGAVVGATASQGSSESRMYQVLVRFDDGAQGVFTYQSYPPFGPGELVNLTPQGLTRRSERLSPACSERSARYEEHAVRTPT
jgi:outer membrane lipoprotein SlyB